MIWLFVVGPSDADPPDRAPRMPIMSVSPRRSELLVPRGVFLQSPPRIRRVAPALDASP
jgi:hypothetical protein